MSTEGPGGQPNYQIPAPFVTHQDMAPVHMRIGALERGQQAILDTYGHIRGELLGRFDRLEQTMAAERQLDAKRQLQGPPDQGISLTGREALLAAVVLIMAGAIVAYFLLKAGVPVERIHGLTQ